MLHGRDPVGERVGRADIRMKPLGCVQVVIHRLDTGVRQPRRLIGVEEAEAGAHLEVVARANLADHVEHFAEHPLPGGAAGDDQTERPGLERRGAPRRLEDLLARQHRILIDLGLRHARLRAVMTILGAQATLCIAQEVEPDPVAPVMAADAVGSRQHVEERLVG